MCHSGWSVAETRTKAHSALNARRTARRGSTASHPGGCFQCVLDSRFRGNDKNWINQVPWKSIAGRCLQQPVSGTGQSAYFFNTEFLFHDDGRDQGVTLQLPVGQFRDGRRHDVDKLVKVCG
jgi:hypothetical protein